jgi:GT2 family glycosyltransferase
VAWATGGLLAVSEACSHQVGPWAEHLFLYEEEVDFCLRASERGWATWYVPEATAVRRVDASELAPWRQGLMRRNRVRRVSAHSSAAGAGVACGLVVGDALRALAGRPEARAGLWSVTHRAAPEAVVRRYLPGAAPVVAAPGSAPSRGQVVQWAQRESA